MSPTTGTTSTSPPRTSATAKNGRMKMLGNTVVPDVARTAFFYLYSGFQQVDKTDRLLKCGLPVGKTVLVRSFATVVPSEGYTIQGQTCNVPKDLLAPWKDLSKNIPTLSIKLNQSAWKYKYEETGKNKLELVEHSIHKPLWSTPRCGCIGASNCLTMRSCNDLATQARFSEDDPHPKEFYLNCQWVEWLMGFPIDWTCEEVLVDHTTQRPKFTETMEDVPQPTQ